MFMGKGEFVWFMGVIEDRTTDPLKLGRCKVRCLGFHTKDKVQLPTADLPWATIMQPITSAAMQGIGETPLGPVEGTWVIGFFRDGVECQEPVVIGTVGGIPELAAVVNDGFNDPNGTYPGATRSISGHGLNESDVNRLARANTSQEHIANTNKKAAYSATNKTGRIISTPKANSYATWNEPSYSTVHVPEYPKNHVIETESGHIVEFDDTTDKTRINTQHKSGTFEEIHNNGDKVTRIVGDHYEVIVGGDNVLVKGACNLTIDGACNTYIKGNWNIQVDGAKTEVVTGEVSETFKAGQITDITGALDINTTNDTTIVGANIHLNP